MSNKGKKFVNKGQFKKGVYIGFGFKKGKPAWNKGKSLSEETKKKISLIKKGKKQTSEHIKKRTTWLKETGGYWKGKKRPNLSGELNPQWKGGVGREKQSASANPEYAEWRSDIFERDNWTCQTCGERGVKLNAHHIKSWAKFPEERYNLDNGVALCVDCHKLTDNYKGKNK